ncbi:protein FAR1-RELATED SEQUENCE 5-like [Canna indica]|uniref:Protein FAR1-RELATED SEQUENCE 5-like n=1 Tax=Canna indica TaxID=4628 RepID=A0AAQ3JSB8_9LILI|nr:protein FAR1-RELATED SEQUENCE 5-like [Canna indica]
MDGPVKCAWATDGSVEGTSPTAGSLGSDGNANSGVDPKVGMTFHSEDQAYNFYNKYAKRKGFSVRKDHLSRRSDGRIRYRHYVCSNEGSRKEQPAIMTKRSRPIERTNCMARIEFKVNNENLWIVNRFIDDHNHPLASPSNSHMLRSHRKKLPVQRANICRSGICFGTQNSQNNIQAEAKSGEDAGFLLKNQSNCLSMKRMKDLETGDTQFLLDFLKSKQSEDPLFFYAIQLDEKERLTNCFWADMQSISDYAYFGDAVSFDTTYGTSDNGIPFAPFIGTNHHKQVVIFGASLLLDETVESFIWLFRTFLLAMSGKQPKTIFTDMRAAISEAIAMTMSNTCHRLCLWHLLRSASTHFPYLDIRFQHEFENLIYGGVSEDDFYKGWNSLFSNYDLTSISWFEDLYSVRGKWGSAYLGNSFAATMVTRQWSEDMDNLFKYHFIRNLPLTKFIFQYLKTLTQLREREILEDYESIQCKPVLFVDIPMLIEAAESYTRTVYADFEQEYKNQLTCLCEPVGVDGMQVTFRVYTPQKQCSGLVQFNSSDTTVTCSCRKFESMGILCMHALKVLNNNNILTLPSKYILKRWTRSAKDGSVSNPGSPPYLAMRYSQVCRKALAVSLKGAVSKDALDILENGLDKIISQMGNVLHDATSSRRANNMDIIQGAQENALEAAEMCTNGFDFSAR